MDGAIGTADTPAVHQVTDHHNHHGRHHQCGDTHQHHDWEIALPHKDGLEWDGENDGPAIAHLIIVSPPLHPVGVPEGGIIGQQGAILDPLEQLVGEVLELLVGRIPLGGGIEEGPLRVAQVEGTVLRQALAFRPLVEVPREDVHGQHVVGALKFSGCGDYRAASDDVDIGVGKDDLPISLQSLAVPVGALIVIAVIPFPGVGGHDGTVDDGIGVHDVLPYNGGDLGKIAVEPGLDLFGVRARAAQLLHILAPQLQEIPEGGHLELLLSGITFGQGHAQILCVLEQFGAHQDHPKDEHAHARDHQKDAQHRIDRPSFAAVHSILSFSRLCRRMPRRLFTCYHHTAKYLESKRKSVLIDAKIAPCALSPGTAPGRSGMY